MDGWEMNGGGRGFGESDRIGDVMLMWWMDDR